jgi:GTP-binding protein
MMIIDAEYVASAVDLKGCPSPTHPEYAFIGRSNVGKSSLINMLVNKKGLAKTSATPGKTRAINHFIINPKNQPWYLVDLPGYGYAKISKDVRKKWEGFIRQYLRDRENLMCTFVLIDARHEAQKIDLEFLRDLGEKGIPLAIIFTKCDKLSEKQLASAMDAYKLKLKEDWETLPTCFFTSAESRLGREEVLSFIEQVNAQFHLVG